MTGKVTTAFSENVFFVTLKAQNTVKFEKYALIKTAAHFDFKSNADQS